MAAHNFLPTSRQILASGGPVDAVYGPFNSLQEFFSWCDTELIELYRGMTVGIIQQNGTIVEYSNNDSNSVSTFLVKTVTRAEFDATIGNINTILESILGGSSGGGSSSEQRYTVSNSLTGVTNSNNSTSVVSGTSYSATLSLVSGYENPQVTITMGGVDITSTAYSNNAIYIATVTGNVVITATATASQSVDPSLVQQNIPATRTLTKNDAAYYVDGYSYNGSEIANDKNGDSDNQSLPSSAITVMVFPLYKGDTSVTVKQMYAGVNASNAFLSSFEGFGFTKATSSTNYVNDWTKGLYADVWNKSKIGTTETNTYNIPSGALYFVTWYPTAQLADWGGVTITHTALGNNEVDVLPVQGRMSQQYQVVDSNLFPYMNANDSELKLNGGCLYYKKFPVVAGTDFKVTIGTRKSSSSLRYEDAWIDAQGNYVASIASLDDTTDTILTPPSGAAYLLLNALNPTDTVIRVAHSSGSGGSGGSTSQEEEQTLLTVNDYIDTTVNATTQTSLSSVLSQAQSEINAIDPNHQFLRVAVISDLHSVPSDSESQEIALYKNTSCNDNIVLFGQAVTQLNCDAGFALGDYSDNRIAYSDKTTEVTGGVDKYKAEAKNVINKLRNSHNKPMFFTMGNHEFGDGLKGQIYNADMCNRIIQTCNRPGTNSVKYINGNGFAYSVSFPSYNVKVVVDSDGASNGWDTANEIYAQTTAGWTVGCMIHGSTTDALNGRHDGTFNNSYIFSGRNIKSFGVIRGHVHGSGQVGFDIMTQSENGHSLNCPRLSVPAGFYTNGTEAQNDHFCVSIFIFDTQNNRTHVVRLGRAEWDRYVEQTAPSFPYSYNFISNDL